MNGEIIENENPEAFRFWLRFWRWVIGLLQIASGLFGFYFLWRNGFQVVLGDGVLHGRLFVPVPFLAMSAVGIVAGVLLLCAPARGIVPSIIFQAAQAVRIGLAGFAVSLIFGPSVALVACNSSDGYTSCVSFAWASASALVRFGAPASMADFGPDGTGTVPIAAFTGVNLVPLLALIVLYYLRRTTMDTSESP